MICITIITSIFKYKENGKQKYKNGHIYKILTELKEKLKFILTEESQGRPERGLSLT